MREEWNEAYFEENLSDFQYVILKQLVSDVGISKVILGLSSIFDDIIRENQNEKRVIPTWKGVRSTLNGTYMVLQKIFKEKIDGYDGC